MTINLNRTERFWLLGGAIASLFIVAFGYLLLVSPEHSNASDLRRQANESIENVATKQKHIRDLAEQNKDLATYQAQLAANHAALPTTDELPNFLRTLQSLGAASGVTVTNLGVGLPSLVTTPVASTPSASTSTAPSTGSTTATTHTGLAGGVYQITINLTANGQVDALTNFLKQLQSVQSRAVLVNSASIGTSAGTSGTSLALVLEAFMAPSSG